MATVPTIDNTSGLRLGSPGALAPASDDLVIYVLNVGDGDAIVLDFPEVHGSRAYAVVDSNDGPKTLRFLRNVLGAPQLRFICATHPHDDHIGGLGAVLQGRPPLTGFAGDLFEFWDSGFPFTSATYNSLLKLVEQETQYPWFRFLRPPAGFETIINGVRLTVLSPALAVRNRYSTWGLDLNNASIVLRVEYPSSPFIRDYPTGSTLDPAPHQTRVVILGGDAQTDAWGQVLADFPHIESAAGNWRRRIASREDSDPLRCDALKVSHHGSKHGVSLELVERMMDTAKQAPKRRLVVSSANNSRKHGLPHMVTQEILREVREPLAKAGTTRSSEDHDLGIDYTAQQVNDAGTLVAAGSIAIVLHARGQPPSIYRLGDDRSQDVQLVSARRVLP